MEQLRAPDLAPELAQGRAPAPPSPPIKTARMESLWHYVGQQLRDPRKARGVRHPIASVIALATLAVAAGCQGPHAIAEFAASLNHGQRRRLRCRPRRGHPRQFDVLCERTFERVLPARDPDPLRRLYSDWMAGLDPQPYRVLHLDGKVIKNADPAPARLHSQRPVGWWASV